MPIKLRKIISTTIIIIALALATHSRALANVAVIDATDDVIVGIVVSVADGDTITVLGNNASARKWFATVWSGCIGIIAKFHCARIGCDWNFRPERGK